ncbi:MAG: type A2 lanthipeptide, partial [Rhodospirillales bacterium]
ELMMEQNVVLEDVSADELEEFIGAAQGVVKKLRKETSGKQREESVAAGVIFEYEEMQVLLKSLQRRLVKIQRR